MPPQTTAPQRRALLPFAVSSRLSPLSVRCGLCAPRRALCYRVTSGPPVRQREQSRAHSFRASSTADGSLLSMAFFSQYSACPRSRST